jgi:hypothetical protein
MYLNLLSDAMIIEARYGILLEIYFGQNILTAIPLNDVDPRVFTRM